MKTWVEHEKMSKVSRYFRILVKTFQIPVIINEETNTSNISFKYLSFPCVLFLVFVNLVSFGKYFKIFNRRSNHFNIISANMLTPFYLIGYETQ